MGFNWRIERVNINQEEGVASIVLTKEQLIKMSNDLDKLDDYEKMIYLFKEMIKDD